MNTISKSSFLKNLQGSLLVFILFLASSNSVFAASLAGSVQTADGTPMCALAIASGQSMFTCGPVGKFAFTDLPLEQDGTITLQVYADGFYPNVQNLSDFSSQQVVMKPAQVCEDDNPGSLTNKQQTEKMIGSWLFAYTIITTFDDYYDLPGPAVPNTSQPGDYTVFGTDENNGVVAATYYSPGDFFSVLDPSILFDKYYRFDFVSSGSISGCYYQVNPSSGVLGTCYPLNGTKLSSLIASSSSGLHRIATKQLDTESKQVNEAEAHRLALASLTTSSAESSEEIQKRVEAQKAYWLLREALEAR